MFSLRSLVHLRPNQQRFTFLSVARLVKPLHTTPETVTQKLPSDISSLGRFRRTWTDEEQTKLEQLYKIYGNRWTEISKHFSLRSPAHLKQRWATLEGENYLGPWTKEELANLKELVGDAKDVDWEHVRNKLPIRRPVSIIKCTWQHSLDPRIKHGKWTKEESDKLRSLVEKHGDNWEAIVEEFGTRTKRQCLERWKWQMSDIKRGHFSPEEDKLIMEAVKEHGDSNFLLIQKVTGIRRTPRHISQHYNSILSPKYDHSPWTEEEELDYYYGYQKCGDMAEVRTIKNSKRNSKDIWNHYYKIKRVLEHNGKPRESKNKKNSVEIDNQKGNDESNNQEDH
ncbi:hypothetical protein CLU79DRAFT_759397 [Phycomyces nitens]|nr:hypothetical protein CLU79DRAFT_759397 [Phycomyces nitens]